jgi:hypothetical protein
MRSEERERQNRGKHLFRSFPTLPSTPIFPLSTYFINMRFTTAFAAIAVAAASVQASWLPALLSPQAGEVYENGSNITIKWCVFFSRCSVLMGRSRREVKLTIPLSRRSLFPSSVVCTLLPPGCRRL